MFNPELSFGQIINNNDLMRIFNCKNCGGMRRSKKTNSLILIMDYTKKLYDDKRYQNRVFFTGMGTKGNMDLLFDQNKTLFESSFNGVELFLFEVHNRGEYSYMGRVKLISRPYQENQIDIEGNVRRVWIFPLELIDYMKGNANY